MGLHGKRLDPVEVALAKGKALAVLEGYGDQELGQWIDAKVGRNAVHVRRRLTDDEWGGKAWGMDVRGTPEAAERLKPVMHLLPRGWDEL